MNGHQFSKSQAVRITSNGEHGVKDGRCHRSSNVAFGELVGRSTSKATKPKQHGWQCWPSIAAKSINTYFEVWYPISLRINLLLHIHKLWPKATVLTINFIGLLVYGAYCKSCIENWLDPWYNRPNQFFPVTATAFFLLVISIYFI